MIQQTICDLFAKEQQELLLKWFGYRAELAHVYHPIEGEKVKEFWVKVGADTDFLTSYADWHLKYSLDSVLRRELQNRVVQLLINQVMKNECL